MKKKQQKEISVCNMLEKYILLKSTGTKNVSLPTVAQSVGRYLSFYLSQQKKQKYMNLT
jgi:hypothetical protein